MTETILIVGSGAREHAIAAALARSSQRPKLVCFGSALNPGIAEFCCAYGIGSVIDTAAVAAFGREYKATLAVVGPEAPLAAGVVDALWIAGIAAVGPRQSLARIESSKGFARDLLAHHNIPGNPFFQRFDSIDGLEEVLCRYSNQHVIKDDGLAGGKGVKVCGDHLHSLDDSLAFCRELVAHGHPFVVEEKIEGEEFSLMSFCDGKTLRHMPAVQDHKRAYDGDRGPNTGGMGTYTDATHKLPFLIDADIEAAQSINERVIAALASECGAPYKGILYGGFMATKRGVKLIEYNARFGDPESLNVLSLLETDFVVICRAIADSTLHDINVSFAAKASVCKYLVPEGYPDSPRKGDVLSLPTDIPNDATIFLSAVDLKDDALVATGSRAVAVVATADSIADAEVICEGVIRQIPGPFFHRTDIGTAAAVSQKVENMRVIRRSTRLKVGVLGSTRGTALQGILDAVTNGMLDVDLVLVASDKTAAPILERAATYGVQSRFIDPAGLKREAYDDIVSDALHDAGAELVLLIGYMRIVSAKFVETWRGRLLNVHPSLLPAFGGLMNQRVHEAVLAAGAEETGCTIHQVTEEVDGGPIVLQRRCAVLPEDTCESLKARVQALEQSAFVEVLQAWRA